jgi:hypothetical protein
MDQRQTQNFYHLFHFVGRKPPRQEIAFISDSVKANNNVAFGNELAWKNMTPYSHCAERGKNGSKTKIGQTFFPSPAEAVAEKPIMSL